MEKDDKTGYEIVVVDNNSSDGTKNVVQEAERSFAGKLRYVFESKQGLSCARNKGIREAKGDFAAFLDDDVIVEKNWLVELVKCIETRDPDCIGGKVLPRWGAKKPFWLTENICMKLGLLDYGDKPFQIIDESTPVVGANFAVRRQIFQDEGYRFETRLGRMGKKLFSGEEIDLFLKLLKNKRAIWYCPSFCVYHDITGEKLKISYFLKWSYYHGKSCGIMGNALIKTCTPGAEENWRKKIAVTVNRIMGYIVNPVSCLIAAAFFAGYAFASRKNVTRR
jgi:GT2 family glycosyltransferase